MTVNCSRPPWLQKEKMHQKLHCVLLKAEACRQKAGHPTCPYNARLLFVENATGDGSVWKFYTDYVSYDGDFVVVDLNDDNLADILSNGDLTWKPQLNSHQPPYYFPSFLHEVEFLSNYPLHPHQVEDLQVGDIDQDGDLDIGFSGQFNSYDNIVWLEKRGKTGYASDNSLWLIHMIDLGRVASFLDFSFADIDLDGQQDLVANLSTQLDAEPFVGGGLAWWKNRGGQFALQASPVDLLSIAACDGKNTSHLFDIEAYQRGRPGDSGIELVDFSFLFQDVDGEPLTSGQLDSMVEKVNVYKGSNQVVTLSDLTLVDGVLKVGLPPGADAQLYSPETQASTSSVLYSVEIVTKSVPAGAELQLFTVTHSTGGASPICAVDSIAPGSHFDFRLK